MTLTLELTPEQEDRLSHTAKAKGVEPADLICELVDAPAQLTVEQAVALYNARKVGQGRAAGLCGLSRAAFIDALSTAGVSPFQYTAEEVLREAGLA